jgi:hypothetical protein
MRKNTRSTIATRRLSVVGLAPVIAAVAAAMAIAAAPAANASANPTNCRGHGGGTTCQKSGHSSIVAKPTTRAPQLTMFSPQFLPGYGKGQLPPLMALD